MPMVTNAANVIVSIRIKHSTIMLKIQRRKFHIKLLTAPLPILISRTHFKIVFTSS